MFEKFSFGDTIGSEDIDKKHESVENATTKKKADSDSKEEENDHGKKRHLKQEEKLRHQMKIAELKQICSWPDAVEAYIEKKRVKCSNKSKGNACNQKRGNWHI